ncbi:DUF3710 domain-containing protein [Corynebacterium sp. CCM 9204]|uniref:DUF3710 domain-containing protein n=1 Tax=Corynebacterium sp. CCM 9204 TaxID=3057616 RepID=UPI003525A7AB
MALFGFGRKKEQDASLGEGSRDESQTVVESADTVVGGHPDVPLDVDAPDPAHDAVNGEVGPFDGGAVDIRDFDFSDFADGALNLGSLVVPLPRGSEVQVEMGDNGPRMLHIITVHGRITPVAFAAPRSAGQWRESTREIAEGMRNDGLEVRIEQGPWGREVVGAAGEAVIRIIGVDGPRWMLRMTLAAPAGSADELAQLGREVTARTFVHRGDGPLPAGQSLPVALPEALAKQVTQAMQERLKKAQETGKMDTRDLRARPATPEDTVAASKQGIQESEAQEQSDRGTSDPMNPNSVTGDSLSPEASAMHQIRKTDG